MGKLSFPPVLQPAKKAYKLSELVDGRFYRCKLSCKIVLYKAPETIIFWNEKEQYYSASLFVYDFQLEDI